MTEPRLSPPTTTHKHVPQPPFEVNLVGHLDIEQLQRELAPVNQTLVRSTGTVRLIINAERMDSYDPMARDWWVREWSPKYRPRIERLAIVTDRTVWHMLALTLGLATSLKIKPFRDLQDAKKWLASNE